MVVLAMVAWLQPASASAASRAAATFMGPPSSSGPLSRAVFPSGQRKELMLARTPMADWIDVCADDLLEGELRGVEVGKRLVLIARQDGELSAIDDFCNHAGCLLSGGWMDVKKRAVVCPCHEYTFEL